MRSIAAALIASAVFTALADAQALPQPSPEARFGYFTGRWVN